MRANINTSVWGRAGWTFLRSIAESYPQVPSDTDKEQFKSFFESLRYMLPCEKCRMNYSSHIAEVPLEGLWLDNTSRLTQWLDIIKQKVDHQKHQPSKKYYYFFLIFIIFTVSLYIIRFKIN